MRPCVPGRARAASREFRGEGPASPTPSASQEDQAKGRTRDDCDMSIILGLESSCDDSAAAVVTGDRRILAQAVAGQTTAHQPYGRGVPEIAARAQVEMLPAVIEAV